MASKTDVAATDVKENTAPDAKAETYLVAAAALSSDPKIKQFGLDVITDSEKQKAAEWRAKASPFLIQKWGRFAYG